VIRGAEVPSHNRAAPAATWSKAGRRRLPAGTAVHVLVYAKA